MGSLQRLPKVIVYGRTPSSLEGVYEIKYYTRQSRRRRRTEAACTSSRTWSCCKRTSLIQLSSAENLLISPLHILSLLLPCCTTVSLPCLLIYISPPLLHFSPRNNTHCHFLSGPAPSLCSLFEQTHFSPPPNHSPPTPNFTAPKSAILVILVIFSVFEKTG